MESTSILDKIKDMFAQNPHYMGVFFVLLGTGMLLSSIFDANWLFGDVNRSTYNMEKIDGWVNMFGRKTARIFTGIMSVGIMVAGTVWFCIYAFYY